MDAPLTCSSKTMRSLPCRLRLSGRMFLRPAASDMQPWESTGGREDRTLGRRTALRASTSPIVASETQLAGSARETSGSDMPKTATEVSAWSSTSRSKRASIASLFHNFAISASVLPCNGSNWGFSPPYEDRFWPDLLPFVVPLVGGVSISLRMRSRHCGSFKRFDELALPPSWAHAGMKQEVVEPRSCKRKCPQRRPSPSALAH